MNKKWLTRFAFIGSLLVAGSVFASGLDSQPGSADDPLVTKSYVDQLFSKLSGGQAVPNPTPTPTAPTTPTANDQYATKAYVDQQIAAKLNGAGTAPSTGSNPELTPPGGGMKVVSLKPGEKIIGYEGTQFIVRTGKVVAVAGQNGDGLPDVTAGKDIKKGYMVFPNHLILIPRSDNRGMKVTSDSSEAWVMVIGGYEIVKP